METLGSRIKWSRERVGLTQTELAERVGVAAGSRVSEWENGRRQPSAPALMALPGVLGVSGHWLLTGEGERMRNQPKLTPDTVVRALERILSGDVPEDVVRMLASPSASAYLTGERAAVAPPLPEPAVPSAIRRRQWLADRIRHHEAPYYLEGPGEAPDPASAGGGRGEGEGEEGGSIYDGGYVWGHLAH